MDREYLSRQYPMWERFQSLRRELDPHNLLINDYLAAAFSE
jgi:FAD/FMN-containing dehydrogenase